MLEVGSRVRINDLSGRFYVNETQRQFIGKTGVVKAVHNCPSSCEVVFDEPVLLPLGNTVRSSLFAAPEEITKM